MFYILNDNIALRSWWRVPYAYYMKGVREARKLTKEEYEFLIQCDGKTELEDSALAKNLLQRELISACEKGAKSLDAWQIKSCDNRYFPTINWMITGKCNYNCLHCFNAADNAPLMSEFSLEEAIKLLDEAEKCGVNSFTITGGEPFCHKNIFEIIENIYSRNMYVEELNSNGQYINQEVLDRLKEIGCKPMFKISFDGLNHHDWLRNREGAEKDALRAIRLCIDNGFCVRVQTNVHRWNMDTILPTAKLMDEMGVDEMRIIRTTESPRWCENAKGATLELDEYYNGMLDFAEKYIEEEHNMDIDIWQLIMLFPRNKSYRMRPVECAKGEYRDSIPVCRGNRGKFAVSANGNIFPCLQMSGYYESKKDILGNVKTDGLQIHMQVGKYLKEVCTTVGELAQANEKCRECKYFKHCVGGCRAIALALTGDKMGVDLSKCAFYKKGYYEKTLSVMKDWCNVAPIDV